MTSHWATYQADGDGDSGLEDVVIRPAVAADCRGVAAIVRERDSVPLADARAHCERDVAGADRLLLVASVGGELAGFARAARWQQPPRAPDNTAPSGWYLLGVVVRDRWRRRGLALELTRRRLDWIRERADEAYYFSNARNRVSIDLHEQLGFVEVTRDFAFPDASFESGEGVLFRVDLAATR
ncbi:MAG TPA: GNAT family N-acetyltransferase [Candidatus Limnocylindrales bacterium]|nr:GNAT family N-acetyltransferase [Candidatus Limnocylindrales bacterium]